MKNINIDLDKIVFDSATQNNTLIIIMIFLFAGFFLEQLLFPKLYSDFIINMTDGKKEFDKKMLLIILGIYLLAQMLFFISNKIESHSVPKIELDVISKISDKVLDSIKTTKKQIDSNEFVMNLKKIHEVKNVVSILNLYVLPTLLISVGTSAYFAYYDKGLGFLTLISLTIAGTIIFKLTKGCFKYTHKSEESMDNFYGDMHDIFNNIDPVIVSNMEKQESERINDNRNALYDTCVSKELCSTNLKFIFSIIYFSIMILLNGFSVKLYKENKIDLATLVSIFFIVLILIQYYESTTHEIKDILHYFGKYNEVKRYLSDFNIDTKSLKDNFVVDRGDILFRDITLSYESGGKIIFNNFNLGIEGRKCTGIIGEIGSGKSSLLKMLIGIRQYSGIVSVDGQDVRHYTHKSVMKHIGYIPQNPKLFNRTIYDNLNYGSNYSMNEIRSIIGKLNLTDFFSKFPEGLETYVGINGEKISGGQRQIVYILRAIIQDKKIILLDEPTSALDEYHKNVFMQLISIIKNKTVIIVTHDKSIYRILDRIITLSNGNIIEDKNNLY